MRKADKRQVSEDLKNDVYFWDGVVCVRSTAITIGSPVTTTISVPNLEGVSVRKRESSTIGMLCGCFVVLFLWLFGLSCIREFLWVGSFLIALSAWPIYLMFKPRPWEVSLKKGGILADESFETKSEQWARMLSEAISRAIMATRESGSGGQFSSKQGIFPDPVLTRN